MTKAEIARSIDRLSSIQRSYVESLRVYASDFNDDFIGEYATDPIFLESLYRSDSVHELLPSLAEILRGSAIHPADSPYRDIVNNWQKTENFLDGHKDILLAWNAEIFLYGSMAFGKPQKADTDFEIITRYPILPRIELELSRALHLAIGSRGNDTWFVDLDSWQKNVREAESNMNPDTASDLFLATKDMTRVFYGFPLGLQKPANVENWRREIYKIANNPLIAGHMVHDMEYAIEKFGLESREGRI